ncbi:MAG: hypothetical protein WCA85_25970 [Paraburkholderia sp.]|uniref:hypothetical protein n=1 Tax=Paraburkholderia sp. TaxID=1926495 RepID=UPI003C648E78
MARFYDRHPRIAFGIAVLAAFACLYIAADWDRSDTNALRLQLMMAASKGAV